MGPSLGGFRGRLTGLSDGPQGAEPVPPCSRGYSLSPSRARSGTGGTDSDIGVNGPKQRGSVVSARGCRAGPPGVPYRHCVEWVNGALGAVRCLVPVWVKHFGRQVGAGLCTTRTWMCTVCALHVEGLPHEARVNGWCAAAEGMLPTSVVRTGRMSDLG
jgi:hypothetical protein